MAGLVEMWRNTTGSLVRLLTVVAFAAVAGCVQNYPVPYSASPGDTIILGLGGIQRNSNNSNTLKSSDLAITLTNNDTHAVTSLSLTQAFKSFPDYNSGLNFNSIKGPLTGVTTPFDGGWFITTTLPSDSSLTPGAYTVSVTSPTGKLVNTKYCYNGTTGCEGDLTSIPLQIVPSSGADNSGYVTQFGYYTPTPNRLDVSPSQSPSAIGYAAVGGLQLVITFPAANYDGTLPIMALPYSHNPSLSLMQNIVDNGDGTKSLVVLLSAPHGFVSKANETALTPIFNDLSLSFFFYPATGVPYSTAQQLGDFQIDQSRSHYFDTNSNVITQLQPVMTFGTN